MSDPEGCEAQDHFHEKIERRSFMPTQTIICLTVFVITLVLYMSNKFPLPLVSMTAMGVYVITGCLAPADALSCFSNSSVI